MDEEKKELPDIEIKAEKSFFSFSEKDSPSEDLPVVTQKEPSKKELKKKEKDLLRAERKKKYPDKLSFLLGLIVLIFAVIGIVLTVWNSVRYIGETTDSGTKYAQYNNFLTPVAAVDPDTFDDITAASTDDLLNAAIWSILNMETTPDTYSYSGGYMLIPSADVGNAYVSMFGPETLGSLTHTTVQGYNCTFEYDKTADVYKIPVTTIMPVYTPQVTAVKKSGTALVITVNYLPAESWAQDDEGNMTTPAPDKVMKITLRELQGSYYISAVQTVSSTVPEVIVVEGTTKPEQVSLIQPETTTNRVSSVKTTLGGR
ncbi:MAG: hypothetical protein IKW03_04345 [Clostridia bacterium]|nr:hypothetical protein [Clostridia bacterium]